MMDKNFLFHFKINHNYKKFFYHIILSSVPLVHSIGQPNLFENGKHWRTPRRKRFTLRLFRLFVQGDRNNKQASSVSLRAGKSMSTGYASLLLRFGRISMFDGSMQINRLSPNQKYLPQLCRGKLYRSRRVLKQNFLTFSHSIDRYDFLFLKTSFISDYVSASLNRKKYGLYFLYLDIHTDF